MGPRRIEDQSDTVDGGGVNSGSDGSLFKRGASTEPFRFRAGRVVPHSYVAQDTIVIVDGRHLIADALSSLLKGTGRFGVQIYAAASPDPDAILEMSPDLVLVVVGQHPEPALRLVRSLHSQSASLRTVIVADTQDSELVQCVLNQAAAALVLTDMTREDLTVIIDQVLRGQTMLPVGWQHVLGSSAHDPVHGLSERQLQVLSLLAEGCTYDEIATRLVITANTVKFHVRSIYLHLGVRNRLAAVKAFEASSLRPRPPELVG